MKTFEQIQDELRALPREHQGYFVTALGEVLHLEAEYGDADAIAGLFLATLEQYNAALERMYPLVERHNLGLRWCYTRTRIRREYEKKGFRDANELAHADIRLMKEQGKEPDPL